MVNAPWPQSIPRTDLESRAKPGENGPMPNPSASFWLILLLLAGCGDSPAPGPSPAQDLGPGASPVGASPIDKEIPPPRAGTWPEEAAARGLTYVNRSGGRLKRSILEANGAGVALLDLEQDGDLDVVFAQGLDSLEQGVKGPGADLEVYLNDGHGQFTKGAGPGLNGWWTGLASGDVNADGKTDLVAAGYGCIEVLMQNDAGQLETWQSLIGHGPAEGLIPGEERPMGNAPLWSTSLALFDADGDGRLDLYVGNYLKLDPLDPMVSEITGGQLSIPCRWKGHEVYCGPRGLQPQGDRFFLGTENRGFIHEPERLIDHKPGFTLAVLPSDVDGDGDTDLLVANDSSANLLLVNDGKGFFRDHGYEAGFAFSADGNPEAGMGLACGDVNRDGLLDYAVTNFSDEPVGLYFGNALGFSNETFRYGLGRETRALLSWSVHLEDFDGDGWLELFTANGHVYPQADEELTGTSYAQADGLWKLGPQPGAQRLQSADSSTLFGRIAGTRGSAVGDLDGDGRPDLVLTTIDGPCALGINDSGPEQHRLLVQLSAGPLPRGKPEAGQRRTPRDAMGARVLLVVGSGPDEFASLRELQTTQGFQSSSSPLLHFGLGREESYRSLRVQWPSGKVTELPAGAADRTLHIEEGRGLIGVTEWSR
ncbi:MAG: hypothetical protein ACI9F9_000174 [Candidatus Paceibacteria bacterium]|jgi:hypothetical protein